MVFFGALCCDSEIWEENGNRVVTSVVFHSYDLKGLAFRKVFCICIDNKDKIVLAKNHCLWYNGNKPIWAPQKMPLINAIKPSKGSGFKVRSSLLPHTFSER